MLVHRKILLDLVLHHAPLDTHGTTAIIVRWEAWGPAVTRWFRVDEISRDFRMHSCGQRYVQHIGPDEYDEDTPSPPRSITIFDFNPYNVRYVRLYKERILAARRNCVDQFEIDVVGEDLPPWDPKPKTQQEKHSNILGFKKRVSLSQVISEHSTGVHGRLPYVRYTCTGWPSYDAVFIDKERLIGIHTKDDTYGIISMDVMYFG